MNRSLHKSIHYNIPGNWQNNPKIKAPCLPINTTYGQLVTKYHSVQTKKASISKGKQSQFHILVGT
jgi:predicted GH43/DUF377 family glycosyl hydrolase